MTIDVEVPLKSYAYPTVGDYSFGYEAPIAAEIFVRHISDLGAITELAVVTDYIIAISPGIKGGTATLTYVAGNNDGTIEIYRDTSMSQETDFINNDPMDMDILERTVDKLCMLFQEVQMDMDEVSNRFIYRGLWVGINAYKINDIVQYPDSKGNWYGSKTVHTDASLPDADTTNWELILDIASVYQGVLAAAVYAAAAASAATAAALSAILASEWSDKAAYSEVVSGRYSAMHWALRAQQYAVTNGIAWLTPWVPGTYEAGTMVLYASETLITNKSTSATPSSSHADWDLVATSATSPDVLEAPIDTKYYARKDGAWADLEILLKTIINKYTIVAKAVNFTADNTDASYNTLYECDSSSNAVEAKIPTMTDGGYAIGDVISIEDIGDDSFDTTIVGDVGVTLKLPNLKIATVRGQNSIVSVRYRSNTVVTLYGDLRNA